MLKRQRVVSNRIPFWLEGNEFMKTGESQYLKFLFWGFVVVGAILPLVVRVAAEVLFGPTSLLEVTRLLPHELLPPYNLLLIALLNDIPFIALFLLAKSHLKESNMLDFKIYFLRVASVVGSGIALFGISLFIQIIVWSSTFRRVPGSSTGPILLFVFPIYGFIAILIGYGIGRFLGKVTLWAKK